jgi:hypothetical protein
MIFFQVQVKDIKYIFNAHLIGKLSNNIKIIILIIPKLIIIEGKKLVSQPTIFQVFFWIS